MAFRNLLQSSFMQSILTFLPSVRHAIESSPQRAEVATPPPAPAAAIEPWKGEVDRWRQVADKTVAERDQLREEAGRLHVEMQRLVHDLGQVRAEAEEMWKTQEGELRRESEEAVKETEERVRREGEEALKVAEEKLNREREETLRTTEERLRREAEESLRVTEEKLSHEREETVRATEERLKREAEEALRDAEEKLRREREEAVQRAEEDAQKVQRDLQALAAELEASKREQQGLQATLDTQQVELKQLKLVVGSDTLGDGDVVRLLKSLNEEIAKTAKSARDLFKLDRNTRANGKVAMEAAGSIEGWVGSALPGLLSTQYRGNPVLLQAAVQALAAAFSSWISSSYSFMHEHDQILDETYKFVMNSENQIVLGRWRALTHKYAKQGMPNLADELTKMFISDVRNLFIVAGSSTTQTDTLISRTRENLRAIVDAAIKLRTAINEDVISCDYETVLIHPGDIFDATNMEDAFTDSAKSTAANAKNVLCTAGLGLRCCRKRDGSTNTQWEVTVLQKPQVILQSAIGQ